ncbi:MAG: glutathione S-transferase N-terminal domain-containing protein [Deltaproteobacteria bacterium]|nr:glutathione S-transferase N-terminal domain-containing protein [Deltaproteobacteria bacterium]
MNETGPLPAASVRVRVFTTNYCGWCRRAELLLRTKGIQFDTIDVTGDPGARALLLKETGGRRTVPVIFVDDKAIGGYQELARLVAAGDLNELMKLPPRLPVD